SYPALVVREETPRELLSWASTWSPSGWNCCMRFFPAPIGSVFLSIQTIQASCRTSRLGLEIVIIKAGSEGEIESAVLSAVQQQASALSIGNDAYLSSRSRQIAAFALRHALPTMSESRDGVVAGLLMSYGPNQA